MNLIETDVFQKDFSSVSIEIGRLQSVEMRVRPEDPLQRGVDCNAVRPLDVVTDNLDMERTVHAGTRNVWLSSPIRIEKKS